jgi:hypothetical protein
MRAYGAVEMQLYSFVTSTLDLGCQHHASAALSPRKAQSISIEKETL